MFIWQLGHCGGIDAVIAKCQQLRIDGLFLKGADGGSLWARDMTGTEQFTAHNVGLLHQAGIKVIGWQYVYGGPGNGAAAWSTVQGEIDASVWIMDQGADGYCFDDEVEMDGKPAIAIQECQGFRAKYPKGSLGYNPYPYPSADVSHPFFEFNSYCDYCMPQLYQRQNWNIPPSQALPKMVNDFAYWSPIWAARPGGRAAIPLLIDWQGASWPVTTPPSDITEAATISRAGKFPLISFFDWDSLDAGQWAAVQQAVGIFHGA